MGSGQVWRHAMLEVAPLFIIVGAVAVYAAGANIWGLSPAHGALAVGAAVAAAAAVWGALWRRSGESLDAFFAVLFSAAAGLLLVLGAVEM